jgi:hypothetical protein
MTNLPMRNVLFAAVSIAAIGVAAPAFAQFNVDVDHGGVRLGIGHDHDRWDRTHWRDRDDYAYAIPCHMVRERFVTPSGHVIYRTHRDCD